MSETKETAGLSRGIVIFHEWLVGAGGAERLAVEEYRFFCRAGIPTRLITFQAEPAALFGLDRSEVEVLPRTGTLDGARRLRRRLRELNPALVIVAVGLRDLYLATIFSRLPYIVHQHEAPFKLLTNERLRIVRMLRWNVVRELEAMAYGYRVIPVPPPPRSWAGHIVGEILSLLDAAALRKALAVTLLSRRAVREVELLYGRDAAPLFGCVSEATLAYQPRAGVAERLGLAGKKIVLSISRLDPMKRLDVAIRAFAQVAAGRDDVVLVIGGRGPSREELQALAASLGVAAQVHFIGFVPDSEIWDYLAMCDVFVCLDWTDFDIAPYEAMSQGRKVLWTNEIETDPWLESAGAVFPVEPTPEATAAGLSRALAAPAVPRAALTRFLEQYTWNKYFERVQQLAISRLEQRGARSAT